MYWWAECMLFTYLPESKKHLKYFLPSFPY
jgi:hypothetical protein